MKIKTILQAVELTADAIVLGSTAKRIYDNFTSPDNDTNNGEGDETDEEELDEDENQ